MAISSISRQILCSFSNNFASKLRFCKKKTKSKKGGGAQAPNAPPPPLDPPLCYTAQFSHGSNLSHNAVARLVARELHSVTSVVSQQVLLLRETLHEVELSSTFRNGLQQLATPLHGVSPPPATFLAILRQL